jgi:hypothetical protein
MLEMHAEMQIIRQVNYALSLFLIKIGLYVKSLERNPPNIKFYENPVTSLRVVTCGKEGMVITTDVFVQHSVAKAPKPCNKIGRTVQQRERCKYWLV